MVLAKLIAFDVLKILHNFALIQKSLLANNCWSKQITKSDQCNLIFIFIELSETTNSFVKMRLVLEIKEVANFIRHVFIENADA